MSKVIQIENLWKEYRLGVIGHGTLTQDLQSWWAKLRGRDDPNSKIPVIAGQEKQIEGKRFWALRDINLDIFQGDMLGIIGKNGAGKSTLLKILSRVTAPSQGTLKVKGRIASLLEVGTGFHHELTGRENIFLNGAILGMSKHEVQRKLDEIIDFSGVEEFIDTPVKRYSSGMYVRLAFAVAAYLEPEILVVDEVLAVGDAEFQKKCLGKMQDVGKEGRTVLFVSHNLPMVGKLCSRCVLLNNGKVSMLAGIDEVLKRYVEDTSPLISFDLAEIPDRKGIGELICRKVKILDDALHELSMARCGASLVIRLYYKNTTGRKYRSVRFGITIRTMAQDLFVLDSTVAGSEGIVVTKDGYIDFYIEKLPLTAGKYNLTLFIEADREIQDWIESGPPLLVEGGNFYNSGLDCTPGFEGKYVLVDHKINIVSD